MKKRIPYSKFKRLIIVILCTCYCNTLLKADSTTPSSLNRPAQNPQQGFLYSLDEPLDNLKSTSLKSAVTPPANDANTQLPQTTPTEQSENQPAESSQLFYPNIFKNDLFTPPANTTNTQNAAPTETDTINQPSAESLSTPVQTTPSSPPPPLNNPTLTTPSQIITPPIAP